MDVGWDQNSFLSEHGHVAYPIKGNDECSYMQANPCFYVVNQIKWNGT